MLHGIAHRERLTIQRGQTVLLCSNSLRVGFETPWDKTPRNFAAEHGNFRTLFTSPSALPESSHPLSRKANRQRQQQIVTIANVQHFSNRATCVVILWQCLG